MNTKVRSFKDRRRRKKGVSPVIGVILMVAATIVIAAVVLAMLGGFAPPKTQYIVTASASQSPRTDMISVTYNGGPDHALVDQATLLTIRVDNGSGSYSIAGMFPTVGNSTTFAGDAGANNDHVTVGVTFTDLSTQVILNTWV